MYRIDGAIKNDPVRRWALSDRIFFASGACHILAWAFLDRYPDAGFRPIWIKPARGYSGNHILAVSGSTSFDYRGYRDWQRIQEHTRRKAGQYWPGWSATLVELPPDVLISEAKSKTYDGLWLREPGQYLQDALPRARAFLDRYPPPRLRADDPAA
jgi:hypothetical protein